jgi:hypothetical protein
MAFGYGSGSSAAAAADMSTDNVQLILADQDRLAEKRRPYESIFRDLDRNMDPFGSGGFSSKVGATTPQRDMDDLYDVTAIEGLDRYTSTIAGLTVPRQKRWHGVEFASAELMKIRNVQRWCEVATDRLFIARYASGTGFVAQSYADIKQEGKYGTSGLWIGEKVGEGLFYKTPHLAELFIDDDYCGQVGRVHRLYCTTILNAWREIEASGRGGTLSDKSMKKLEDPKARHDEIEILHVVRPNAEYEPGYLGPKGMPIESLYIEVDSKHLIRRSGYYSMPIPVSRASTMPGDPWGRSPAMKVLATVKGLQVMARTIIDAGNKSVDPPLLFNDDSDITKIITKPGGATAGGVDDQGRQMVHPLYTGAQLPIGLEMQQSERATVQRVFLEEFYRLITNPSDRMTATQVIEQLNKEGVLIAPFAGRRETEKLGPMIDRELEIMMRAGAIPPLPDEAKEAGARPKIRMNNPLSRMARAEEVSGFTRTLEIGVQAVSAGLADALDRIKVDEGMVEVADVLGVRPSIIRSDEEVAQIKQDRTDKETAAQAAQVIPAAAGAAKDLASANDISTRLASGGGMG